MQISYISPKPIPSDSTLVVESQKATQLSINLDAHRYVLVRRLGRVFERTNKDVLIDLLDLWLDRNIEMSPKEEQEDIKELLAYRRAGNTISNHKPQ